MSPEKNLSKELITVFETAEEAEALVVHGLLESAGIESLITSLLAQQEILPGVGGVVLRVAPEHAEEVRHVIEEYRASPGADMEPSGEPEPSRDRLSVEEEADRALRVSAGALP